MKKISPLGSLMIAIYVANWNAFKGEEEKVHTKTLLLSGNAIEVNSALTRIKIIADVLYDHKDIYHHINTDHLIELIIRSLDPLRRASRFSLIDDMNRDVVTYFIEAFNAGNLDQLPMPEPYVHEGFKLPYPDDGEDYPGPVPGLITMTPPKTDCDDTMIGVVNTAG